MFRSKLFIILVLFAGSALAAYQVNNLATRNRLALPDKQKYKEIEITSIANRGETSKYDLSDVALLDKQEAWAVGYDGKNPERVYHSNDCGENWNPIGVSGNNSTLKAISFSDTQHGWAVGGNGLIIRTVNGGKSWNILNFPEKIDLQAVHFINSEAGYVAGKDAQLDPITDEVKGSTKVFLTKDGGETWQSSYRESRPLNVFQIHSSSNTTAFIVIGGNRLIRTDDQGHTWREIPLPTKNIRSISVLSNNIGWIVGNKGTFLHSEDGGNTWNQIVQPDITDKSWESVGFNSNGVGIAVGLNGALAFTYNYGKSWHLQTPAIDEDLRVVRLYGSSAIVLGAIRLYSIKL